MIVRDCTVADLRVALAEVNKKYEGNVTFNQHPVPNGRGFRFTLRVEDSQKPGHRLTPSPNYRTGKHHRMVSACWHVHGDFFDALLEIAPEAEIRVGSKGEKIFKVGDRVIGNWEDRNIGSMMHPFYYSEACECGL